MGKNILFTNGCKKALKYVLIVNQKTLKTEVQEEGLNDIFVRIAKLLLARKEDLKD